MLFVQVKSYDMIKKKERKRKKEEVVYIFLKICFWILENVFLFSHMFRPRYTESEIKS